MGAASDKALLAGIYNEMKEQNKLLRMLVDEQRQLNRFMYQIQQRERPAGKF
jgi:hypothetical protein